MFARLYKHRREAKMLKDVKLIYPNRFTKR